MPLLNKKNRSGAGTGGGVTIEPIAFIAVTQDRVQVHPITKDQSDLARILSLAPGVIKKVSEFVGKKSDKNSDHQADESAAGSCVPQE